MNKRCSLLLNSSLLLLSLSLVLPAFGQEMLAEFGVTFKGSSEAFTVNIPESNSTLLFLLDGRTVRARLFDKDFNLVDSLNAERPRKSELPKAIGHCRSGNMVTVFFSSEYYNTLAALHFDFARKKVTTEEIELPVQREQFAGAVSAGDDFYLFTAAKSALKLYAFKADASYEMKSYDVPDSKSGTFSKNPTAIFRKGSAEVMDQNFPPPLRIAKSTQKLYSYPDRLILTIDSNPSETTLITIDGKSLEATIHSYPQAETECKETMTSNSYVHEGHLFQVIYCFQRMVFRIINLSSDQVVKEINITRDDELDFVNSEEPPRPTKFIRRTSQDGGLISVYRTPRALVVTLGAHSIVRGSSGQYAGVNSVEVKSLLDPVTFEHLKGMTVPKTTLDKMREYRSDITDYYVFGSKAADTAFMHGNEQVLGYFDIKTGKYRFVSFGDPLVATE